MEYIHHIYIPFYMWFSILYIVTSHITYGIIHFTYMLSILYIVRFYLIS